MVHIHVELIIDEAIPVRHLELHGYAIDLVISDRVARNEAFQLGCVPSLISFDELIHLLSKLRHVNASIRLTCNVDVVILNLGESHSQQFDNSGEVIISGVVVREIALSWLSTDRIANACRAIKVEDGGLFVPGVLILDEVLGSILDNIGSVLLSPSEHGGAARTTVEPQDDGVGLPVVLAEGCDIMELLFCAVDQDHPRV